jgi:hypothetical protein
MKHFVRRMKHPAHAVVDELGLGERLMATLVSHDPETGCEKTGPKTVQRPQRNPRHWVKNGMGQTDGLRSNESVKERSSLVYTTNDDTVPCAVTEDHASAR